MRLVRNLSWAGAFACVAAGVLGASPAWAQGVLTGPAAYGDWRGDAPGVARRITPGDLPPPFASRSASNFPGVADPPPAASLHVPRGFVVQQFASGLRNPRIVRVAPNGDIFIAESSAGRIRIMRAADGAERPDEVRIFATGLDQPFGMAFFPPGPDPDWLYVASNNAVARFPYRNGDLQARGAAQTVVRKLSGSSGHHWTRDLAFSLDGRRMFVSVGSGSNVAEGMPRLGPEEIRRHEARYGLGSAWGNEELRADVLAFDPDGTNLRVLATGIRNCSGLAVHPRTGDLWCATNERDGLGDDLPPDYATRVREGAFYGWPWYYIGPHEDPRHRGERADLAARVTVPDVLIQPHSAPLGMVFYQGAGVAAFPSSFRGDAFVALHGSWNRGKRTGYKVVRVRLRDGVPDGTYEDFLTGFVVDDEDVSGRPVGVAVAHDGALLVTEDGNGTVWRVSFPFGQDAQ
ncbi:PQQ-dependent sugar dehydrogenase [Limobrevibacterium gyesilva]|uniref:PQQ-dependent sugar dehydrogenase n=1 Tax=Limobrevibacterium gyesilva TaxID=2991712 RepID=A0AA41YK71_9PROT|nr:PQQ-dependent sugar dehydrogenase [Limobrevibacterium gyesilva]